MPTRRIDTVDEARPGRPSERTPIGTVGTGAPDLIPSAVRTQRDHRPPAARTDLRKRPQSKSTKSRP